MNNETQVKTENIKRWLKKSLSLEKVTIKVVEDALVKILESKKFRIRSHSKLNGSSSIEAIYGTKKLAFPIALIPIIGKHLPAGKRFMLKAELKADELISLDISITPFMELIDSEEIGNITQLIPEKASDEYVAAKMLFFILRELYSYLGLPRPKELSKFDIKSFANDTLWGVLLFYLDSYGSAKTIYTVQNARSPWCWGAFLSPEFWFLWHEMWGASALLGFPTGLFAYFERYGWPHIYIKYTVIAMIVLCRIIAGLIGNRLFYARYGYSLHAKQYEVPEEGPTWNWGAFIIPEFWFMWHEIIGISFIAIALNVVLFFYVSTYLDNFLLSIAIFFFIRIIFGLRGNKLYYAKYGTWPK